MRGWLYYRKKCYFTNIIVKTNDKTFGDSQYMQVFIAGIVVAIFTFEHITSLRFTAQLSFYCIIFVVGVVVAEYYLRPSTDLDSILGPLDKFGEFPSFILAIPNIFKFTITCKYSINICE